MTRTLNCNVSKVCTPNVWQLNMVIQMDVLSHVIFPVICANEEVVSFLLNLCSCTTVVRARVYL